MLRIMRSRVKRDSGACKVRGAPVARAIFDVGAIVVMIKRQANAAPAWRGERKYIRALGIFSRFVARLK